jgi:hypothetical protein
MRSLEITLKFCFLILAITLIATSDVLSVGLWSFLVVSFALGVVLTINKRPSYMRATAKSDFKIRKIEGAILVVFSIASLILLNTI